MKSDIKWRVVTVAGHLLEKTLTTLTEEHNEIVTVERAGTGWTIISRGSERGAKKANVIGFTPQKG